MKELLSKIWAKIDFKAIFKWLMSDSGDSDDEGTEESED